MSLRATARCGFLRRLSKPLITLLVPAIFQAGLAQAAPPVRVTTPAAAAQSSMVRPAVPTAAGGCSPTAGRILQRICESGVASDALLQFEDETVAEWLALHEIPAADASLIYQHGRSDLRSEIRAFMLSRLVGIAQGTEDSAHDAEVFQWFQSRLWDFEKEYWDRVVQLRNEYLANRCTWEPDPEIAAEFAMSFEPPLSCSPDAGLISLFVTDEVVVPPYFLIAALKELSESRLAHDPTGQSILATTAGNAAMIILAVAAAAYFVAAASSMAVFFAFGTAATLSYAIGGGAFLALGTATLLLVPIILIAVGIVKFIQVMEDQDNRNALMAMDQDRNAAYATAPDPWEFALDGVGYLKLLTVLTADTLPEFSSTSTVPAHAPTDLPFNVTTSLGTTLTLDSFTWADWDDETWTGQTAGAWLVGTRADGATSFGSTFRYRNWAGEKYTASRAGRRFMVTKGEPDEDDAVCPADTRTGLSTETGSNCKSFITTDVQMKDAAGQNVTIALPSTPAFFSPDRIAFRRQATFAQDFDIHATGAPLPTIGLAPGAGLPPDLHLLAEAEDPGNARLVFLINSPLAAGTYTTTVRATNAAGFVDQTITIDVSDVLRITSPSSATIQVGVPYNVHVQAVGEPPLTLSRDGLFGPIPAFTFTDHGNGTATVSGTASIEQQLNCFNFGEDFEQVPCGFEVTEAGGAKFFQEFTFNILPAPVPVFTSRPTIRMDRGISNIKKVTASNDATGVRITMPCPDNPSWLSLAQNLTGEPDLTGSGNGTAYLVGTPPVGSTVEEIEVYLHAKPASFVIQDDPEAECASQAFPRQTIRLVPRPHFTGGRNATLKASESFVVTTNMPSSQEMTMNGFLPAGLTFDPPSRTLSGPAEEGAGGVYYPVFRMENEHGQAEMTLELTLLEPPILTSTANVTFVAGHPNQHFITASGFPRDTMTFTPLDPLPPGFTLTQTQDVGVLGGAPAPGTYLIPIRIRNGDEAGFTTDVTLTVVAVAPAVLVEPSTALLTSEEGASNSFSVRLATQPSAGVTISLGSTNPNEGTVAPETLTFTDANWATPQEATITGVDDAVDDGDVVYGITFAASSSDPAHEGLSVADVPVTNQDDDAASVAVTPTSGLITTEGSGSADFTIVLGSEPLADVVVGLTSSNSDEGTVAPPSLTFTPANWSTPQTATVTGVDDAAVDGAVAYTIETGATSGDVAYDGIEVSDVAVTNVDDDAAGIAVSPTGGLTTTEEGGTADFTIVLGSHPLADVVVGLTSSNTDEGTVEPTSLTFNPENWSTPQTATVTGVDDSSVDGDIVYTIQTAATSSDPAYDAIPVADLAITNIDDESSETDQDGDGVDDVIEDGGPNGGDGNGDGTPDRLQGSVASIFSAAGETFLTLSSTCPLSGVIVTDEQSVANDAVYDYPFGLIAFRAACASGDFSLLVHTAVPVPETYRKYGPNPPGAASSSWYTLPGTTWTAVAIGGAPATRIDFALTDGTIGDDTIIDGVIVDQGGPGVPAPGIPMLDPRWLMLLAIFMAMAAAWIFGKGTA